MSISTILSIVSMKSPSTNLNENDSILASREFIHRLLAFDRQLNRKSGPALTGPHPFSH